MHIWYIEKHMSSEIIIMIITNILRSLPASPLSRELARRLATIMLLLAIKSY